MSEDLGFSLQLVGYRAFADSGVFELSPGRTAFIGVNNAGKSSILRSLYETRRAFTVLASYSKVPGYQPMTELLRRQLTAGFNIDLRSGERIEGRTSQTPEIRLGLPPSPYGDDDQLWPTKVSLSFSRNQTAILRLWGPLGELPTGTERVWNGVLNIRKDAPNAPVYRLAGTDLYVDLTPVHNISVLLSKCFYVGAFRNALNVGSLTGYYDLQLGEAFVKRYGEMKSGDDPGANEAIGVLMRDLARIFNYQQLEVSPDPSQTRLQYLIDGLSSYRDSELGAGIAQFVLVAANVLVANPTILLIDEPETNLHASLQLDFLNLLASSASWGVLFSTHNPGLARIGAERTYVVNPSPTGSTVSELTATPNLSSLLGQLGYLGSGDTAYDGVLLVEGSTDVPTFRELLRLYGKEHRFAVLSSGGGDLINAADPVPVLVDLLRATDGRLQVCIDSERGAAAEAISLHHRRFAEACRGLNVPCTVLERRSIECYFPEAAVRAVFGPMARQLGPFERTKDAGFGWSKAKNWKVARKTRASDLTGTDLGQLLERL